MLLCMSERRLTDGARGGATHHSEFDDTPTNTPVFQSRCKIRPCQFSKQVIWLSTRNRERVLWLRLIRAIRRFELARRAMQDGLCRRIGSNGPEQVFLIYADNPRCRAGQYRQGTRGIGTRSPPPDVASPTFERLPTSGIDIPTHELNEAASPTISLWLAADISLFGQSCGLAN